MLAADDVAVDAALQAELVIREGLEAEVEQALAVALTDAVGKQIAQEALRVVRMRRLAEEALERPEGSQVGDEQRTGRASVGGNWRGAGTRLVGGSTMVVRGDTSEESGSCSVASQPRFASSNRRSGCRNTAPCFLSLAKPLPRAGSWVPVGWEEDKRINT